MSKSKQGRAGDTNPREQTTASQHTTTIIPIDDEYRLAGDALSWQIQRRRTRKGRATWESVTWHTSIDQAVRALGDRLVRTSGAQTLQS